MIEETFLFLAERLEEYLSGFWESAENMVEVKSPQSMSSEEVGNQIVLALLNMERETTAGIAGGQGERGVKGNPAWSLNLTVSVAAVFENKRYREGLKALSMAIRFFQQENVFWMDNRKITLEFVNVNLQELANIWGILGGHYYPSFICKLRLFTFNGSEAKGYTPAIHGTKV